MGKHCETCTCEEHDLWLPYVRARDKRPGKSNGTCSKKNCRARVVVVKSGSRSLYFCDYHARRSGWDGIFSEKEMPRIEGRDQQIWLPYNPVMDRRDLLGVCRSRNCRSWYRDKTVSVAVVLYGGPRALTFYCKECAEKLGWEGKYTVTHEIVGAIYDANPSLKRVNALDYMLEFINSEVTQLLTTKYSLADTSDWIKQRIVELAFEATTRRHHMLTPEGQKLRGRLAGQFSALERLADDEQEQVFTWALDELRRLDINIATRDIGVEQALKRLLSHTIKESEQAKEPA